MHKYKSKQEEEEDTDNVHRQHFLQVKRTGKS